MFWARECARVPTHRNNWLWIASAQREKGLVISFWHGFDGTDIFFELRDFQRERTYLKNFVRFSRNRADRRANALLSFFSSRNSSILNDDYYFWISAIILEYWERRTSEIAHPLFRWNAGKHEVVYLRGRLSQKSIFCFFRNFRYIRILSRRFRIWREQSCIGCIQKSYRRLFDRFSWKWFFSNLVFDSFRSPCPLITIIEERIALSSSVRHWELNEKLDFPASIGRSKSENFFRASWYRFSESAC